ncbi:MAG: hypothetical protein J1F35_04110 [Erysipelotrichales bacterium]|nr:hypothetical protein [Erysipelotrichales bacterium]
MKKNSKKNKSGNKVIESIQNKKTEICYLVVGVIIGLLIMLIFWPERIVTLENGEEVLVEIKGKKFTANDLYKEMKISNGNEALFNMVDLAILKDKYPNLEEEAEEYAKSQSEEIYTSYQSYYGYTKEEFLATNGFKDEGTFLRRLNDEYYYQKYYDEYVESTIKEKDIKEYYKDHVFGEKSVYVFTASTDDNDLESVRKDLKAGKTFNKIKEKYSNVYSYSYESIKFTDTDTLTQTVLDKIGSTKKGKYSSVFDDDTYGHVVVFVVDEKKKESLDDIRDTIVETMVAQKQESDGVLYYQAFIKLRSDYGLNIYDTELKKLYDDTVKTYK